MHVRCWLVRYFVINLAAFLVGVTLQSPLWLCRVSNLRRVLCEVRLFCVEFQDENGSKSLSFWAIYFILFLCMSTDNVFLYTFIFCVAYTVRLFFAALFFIALLLCFSCVCVCVACLVCGAYFVKLWVMALCFSLFVVLCRYCLSFNSEYFIVNDVSYVSMCT